uniref:Uncharacterized protein n=1 Tax=Chromera velia CCMP2878 TaxID=1169474 RepID=A0A0G4HE46_9ALVE|eukprot:Cvel_26654.t1-p1 / transcript=Cvel_26654.t1 / gene=Cvel_26654 / organism=Chromera_velia_CCMP2878 / gene_product=hypothetical protein / transcript_product=hypothetical protein / location=Cvel_scaffold3207:2139-5758(+) / protein_length=356 / sequence_SO=supercontig / SO=protein_coding / is_pseudo=false
MPQTSTVSPAVQVTCFVLMVIQRANHAFLVEFAKEKERPDKPGTYDYAFPRSNLTFTGQLLSLLVAWLLASIFYGRSGFEKSVDPSGIIKMWYVGVAYCFDDILELEANRYMDSATYTVLSQGKILLTAVLCEFAMKSDSNNFLVQFVQIKVTQCLATAVYTGVFFWREIWENGLFGGFTWKTVLLLIVGYLVKALLTQYVLKVLNSLLKNITEVLGMMGTYFERLAFKPEAVFRFSSFLAALQVMIAVIVYVGTKAEKQRNEEEMKKIRLEAGLESDSAPLSSGSFVQPSDALVWKRSVQDLEKGLVSNEKAGGGGERPQAVRQGSQLQQKFLEAASDRDRVSSGSLAGGDTRGR